MSIEEMIAYIAANTNDACVFEQTAEECTELAKACLKVARIMRKENPTPVKINMAMKEVVSETNDLFNMLEVLHKKHNCIREQRHIRDGKIRRWYERLVHL